MALEAFLDEKGFSSLPDPVRSHYEKGEDDNYHLRVTPKNGWELQNVETLRKAAATERRQREEWERRHRADTAALGELAKLTGKDAVDLDEIRGWREELERLRKANPDEIARGKLAELEKRLKEGHQATVDKLSKERDAFAGENQRLVLARDVASIVSDPKSGAYGANLDLLSPHIENAVKVLRDPETGRYTYDVLDDRGEPGRLSTKPGSTEKMGLREFLETVLRGRFPQAFPSSGAAGGRAGGAGGSARTGGTGDDNLSPTERLRRARERANGASVRR